MTVKRQLLCSSIFGSGLDQDAVQNRKISEERLLIDHTDNRYLERDVGCGYACTGFRQAPNRALGKHELGASPTGNSTCLWLL
ncbi:hypothetical protein ROE7235_03794 [Roseibaca ekhonensis]|jgi:hypothetical protein|uniref:Uncharacterized protein n=1 Tax=Roseinatronobacter ekhonensis TaxID=254356 RepID=A0A3B0MEJ5_9RHOB|nr:hypothetical protein ROE7235_03794 [Roseibaca ekhonensis]